MQIGAKEKGTATNTFLAVCACLSGIGFLLLIVSIFFEYPGARYPATVTELWHYLQSARLTDTLWIYSLLWVLVINAIVMVWGFGQLLVTQLSKQGSQEHAG